MTFKEIQDEVIELRFNEARRASVKHWINLRYQAIWAYTDWPWRRQGPSDLTIVSGSANPTLPSDFLRPVAIYDDLGNELTQLEADEFDADYRYADANNLTGRPETFKWVNDVITLGMTPGSDYIFGLTYERKTSYLSAGTTPTVGLMTGDSDQPIFDSAYHYILVSGAVATGLRMENDPTFPAVEDDYMGQLRSMQDYYLPSAAATGHLQYGRDEF